MMFSSIPNTTHGSVGQTRVPQRTWQRAALLTMSIALVTAAVVADSRTRPLLWNTLLFAGGAALLALPLGTALALLLHRTDLPGRRLLWRC